METRNSAEVVVLVVDDEELVRMTAIDILGDAGFTVLAAASAPEALGILMGHPEISVLFSDINMPGAFDGLELARKTHTIRPDVALILTSGRDHPNLTDLGAEFVSKPYQFALVSTLIRASIVRGTVSRQV